jgi:predicted kinase
MVDRSRRRMPSMMQGGTVQNAIDGETPPARHLDGKSVTMPIQRDPANTLNGCQRILILGRTGSGKTTLARELAASIGVPHVELDALYFGPDFSTVPLSVLRERTSAAVAGDRWVTDGNKSAVRDLVWPRADTVIWLDYPWVVSFWRLGKRALWRTSVLTAQAAERGGKAGLPRQFLSAAKGVLTALRSHMGQRREYRRMFTEQENLHLVVLRLRSPHATRRWLARVLGG